MEKITITIGHDTGKRTIVRFTGEEVTSHRFLDEPGRDSRGSKETLYRLPDGRYRVETRRWSQWQGEEDDNYANIEGPLTREELIEQFGALASNAGLMEEIDLDTVPTR